MIATISPTVGANCRYFYRSPTLGCPKVGDCWEQIAESELEGKRKDTRHKFRQVRAVGIA